MKKHLIILSALLMSVFCSCSEFGGDPVTKEFSIDGPYTALSVSDAFKVTVSDKIDRAVVTAGEGIMEKVRVDISGSTLIIHLRPWTINMGPDMEVIIPYNPDLTTIHLSGASEFRSSYGIGGDEMSIHLSGASEFTCDVNAEKLELDLSGASAAKMIGAVSDLRIGISGSSRIAERVSGGRYAFSCDKCEGSISGASRAYIHCDGQISVSLSGASTLHYTGNASTSGSHTSGASGIIHEVL